MTKTQLSATEQKAPSVRVSCDHKIQEHNIRKQQGGGVPPATANSVLRMVLRTKISNQTQKNIYMLYQESNLGRFGSELAALPLSYTT